MWLKLVNLVGLVLATVWLSRAPDWEPLLTTVTLFLTLLGQEWRDRKKRQPALDAALEHDLRLFRRYDDLMSEGRLRDELNGSLYNRRTDTAFTDRLRKVLELAALQEGSFVQKDLKDAFEDLVATLDALRDFLGRNFFDLKDSDPDGNRRLMLHPELRHERGAGAERYESLVTDLGSLCEEAEEKYVHFRAQVKKVLLT